MSAVNQIAAERGIPSEEVIEAIEAAIRTGFKHDYGMGESLVVDINSDTGVIGVFADKKVVETVSNKSTQISLEDAKKIESKLKVGDHVQVDITPEGDFGRIAAQAAKQVILQKIRESEKETAMSEVVDKIGTIETGVVQRMDGDSVIVEVRKATGVMPYEERVPREFYKSGSQVKLLLKEIKKGPKGKTLIVSRAAPEFLGELFAIEIPEIMSGSVEIMGIAREAGSRSKIAVRSNQPGVDPIGSCVGQRGVRINAIMDELKGEKIDIIVWDEDVREYIANALSPAQVESIEIDQENQSALVTVPDDQLSLAIGKEGQNVRLAAKLTNWKIDIKGVSGETVESADGKKENGEGEEEKEDAAKEEEKKGEDTEKEGKDADMKEDGEKAEEKADTEAEEEKAAQEKGEEAKEEPKAEKDAVEASEEDATEAAETAEEEREDETSEDSDSGSQEESEAVDPEIEALGLSKRVNDAVANAGVTINDLQQYKKNGTLTDIAGIGPKAAEEISSKLP